MGDDQENGEESIIKWTDDSIRFDTIDEEPERDFFDPFSPNNEETFEYSFPLNEKTDETLDIELKGYSHDSDVVWKSTGLAVWRAADFFGRWMIERRTELLPRENQRILELGSGLGLNGILVHLLDPSSRVFLTDGDSEALVHLKRNIELNRRSTLVSGHQLIWGRESSTAFRERYCGRFNLILASDIIYVESIIEPLWDTIINLMETGGLFVMAFARRRVPVSIEFVLESAEKAGLSYLLEKEDDGLYIYSFRCEAYK